MNTLETTEQRMRALQDGNRIRLQRAAIRRNLRGLPAGRSAIRAAEMLETFDGDPAFGSWKTQDLIVACHGIGEEKSRVILRHLRMTGLQRVRDLPERQRWALAHELREHAHRYLANQRPARPVPVQAAVKAS